MTVSISSVFMVLFIIWGIACLAIGYIFGIMKVINIAGQLSNSNNQKKLKGD